MNRKRIAMELVTVICAGGGSIVGAILFGSVARGSDTKDSDIDLLFVVDNESPSTARREILKVVREAAHNRGVAASVETYARLSRFADLGDPFVRTILSNGEILRDSGQRLMQLREQCADRSRVPSVNVAAKYLHAKALFHHQRLQQQLRNVLGDLQLSLMARAQAVAVLEHGTTSPEALHELSDWHVLELLLRRCGIGDELLDQARVLTQAHKAAHTTPLLSTFRDSYYRVAEALDRAFDARSFLEYQNGPALE